MDPIAAFKDNQRKSWSLFAPFETLTAVAAPRLVTAARIVRGCRVLDVGCGTGVVAIAAARTGASVVGVDLTPELLERARDNALIAGVEIEWHLGDVEQLPFNDAEFDIVVSQFGHMFAPRPELATREMLRVLRPGGTIAFSTWPPELYTGRLFTLISTYLPPPPGIASPAAWGDPAEVRVRLGNAVKDLKFDRDIVRFPTVSPGHVRLFMEKNAGPVIGLVKALEGQPERLAQFRRELDGLIAEYFDNNVVRQDFLVSRATKV